MNDFFDEIRQLIRDGRLMISDHGYDELAADNLYARDVIESVAGAVEVESYPDYPKGPCVLVLQQTPQGDSIHVVWGIPKGESSPAVLVTAYRPDPDRWEPDLKRRRP